MSAPYMDGVYDENGQLIPGTQGHANSSTANSSVSDGINTPVTNSSTFGTSVADGYNPPPALPPPPPPPGAPPALPPPGAKSTGYTAPASHTPTGAPTPPPPVTPSPGLLSTPGAYEEWIKAHQSELDNPTRTEGLYDSGATSVLDNSPLSGASNTNSAASYNDWLASHGSVTGAGNSQNVLNSGIPTSLALSDVSLQDSAAEYNNWLASHGAVTGAGNSSGVLSGLSTGPSKASDVYTSANGTLSKPGATENVYGEHGDAFDSTGSGEDWYSKYGDDPMQKSYSETMYEGGIGQLDPAYQYALDKALQKARTSSSARSQFNSTYAGQEERDLIGNLTGQQASKWVDFAPVADAARRSRYDQGEKYAGDNNSQYRQRIEDMFGLAKTNDDETRARLDSLSNIAFRGDSADTARDNTRVSAANNADRSATDVYNAEQGAHRAGADVTRLQGDQYIDLARSTDSANTANAGLRVSAASNADRSATDVYSAEQGAQAAGSNLTRLQGDQNIDLATRQDASNRANLTSKFGLAGAADSSDIGRLMTQGQYAKDLQNTGQNRINGALDATTSQADREAKLVNDIYSDTANIDNMDDTALQALADKYGVSLQELNSVKDDAKSVIGLLTQAIKGK